MNEKIKELFDQAKVECFNMGSKTATTVGYDELEKFAELIVEELVQRLRFEGELATIQAFVGSIYKTAYMNEAANIVKQHFGVE